MRSVKLVVFLLFIFCVCAVAQADPCVRHLNVTANAHSNVVIDIRIYVGGTLTNHEYETTNEAGNFDGTLVYCILADVGGKVVADYDANGKNYMFNYSFAPGSEHVYVEMDEWHTLQRINDANELPGGDAYDPQGQ